MKAYLGTIGRLVELPYVSDQSLDPPEDYTFETTLEGRVKAQARAVKRRTWSLSVSRYLSGAQGTLMSFINGEWGRGPFVWVSVDAQVTNMLTPAQASCDPAELIAAGVVGTGPLLTPDGWAGRSYTNSTPASTFSFGSQGAPILPGQAVTASAYLVGAGAAVRIRWEDAAGVQLSVSTGAAQGEAGVAKRCWVTDTPPAGAAQARVQAVNTTQATRPALTWTDSLLEWSDGQGCPKAVLHAASRNLQMVSKLKQGLRTADMSFTITEVG